MKILHQITAGNRSQQVRRVVQVLFLAIVCFIGFKFTEFAGSLEKGLLPAVERPAGAGAFLPISALVSLKYAALTGIINEVHPSALVLFLIICTTVFFVRKGFCSYVCPFGLLSEYLASLQTRIFPNGIRLPPLADKLLRSIKYGLAGVFIYFIFFKMPMPAIHHFIHSPYHILADISMYRFFVHISPTALGVVFVLILMSILVQHFWCRYLCPYGALLGVLSLVSLGRIRFHKDRCKGCGKCEKVCPGRIPIRKGKAAFSLECSACLQCIQACPEKDVLEYGFPKIKSSIGTAGIALIFLFLFIGGISLAKWTGHWDSTISKQTLFYHMMTQGMLEK